MFYLQGSCNGDGIFIGSVDDHLSETFCLVGLPKIFVYLLYAQAEQKQKRKGKKEIEDQLGYQKDLLADHRKRGIIDKDQGNEGAETGQHQFKGIHKGRVPDQPRIGAVYEKENKI